MTKKLGNVIFDTYHLSKCNLKGLVSTVYPLQIRVDVCLICGGELWKNYSFASQINESECVKINGTACIKCDAFFTKESRLIDWLKIKKYNEGVPVINDTYNMKYDFSKQQHIFNTYASVFRQFLMMSEKKIIAVSITYNRNDENKEKWIFHYSDSLANNLLKAELTNSRVLTINGDRYVIIQTKKRIITDEEINNEIFYALEHQVLFSEELPSFSSDTTVYVYKGNLSCHTRHHMTEVRVIIKDISSDMRFFAEYCHECNKYLMKYADYKVFLKRFKLFPSKVTLLNNYSSDDFFYRAECSPLILNGYSVSDLFGLFESERQRILTYIIDYGILTKRKVLDYLEMFVATHYHNERFRSAISKWEADKQFLLNYSERNIPLVIVGRVERMKR